MDEETEVTGTEEEIEMSEPEGTPPTLGVFVGDISNTEDKFGQ